MKYNMTDIKRIVKEEVELFFEAKLNDHSFLRLKQRLEKMERNNDLTPREVSVIRDNLQKLLSYEFPQNKSYGILLGVFKPNPNSTLYTDTNKWDPGIPFYEIFSENEQDVVKDSTGDEFWGVIRNNEITTVMLRKRNQRASAGNERMDDGGLGVDVVAINVDKLIRNEEEEKLRSQQSQNKNDNILNINGVKWAIDRNNQIIHKKNNPSVYVKFDDVLENPYWDYETGEEIFNKIV
jgi:hypothetical protein